MLKIVRGVPWVDIMRPAEPGQLRRQDRASAGVRAWFGARILEVDEAVLIAWRRLVTEGKKARYTFSHPDALIAATARVHELAVATRNAEDFVQAGVPIFNPWLRK
jgi:predicted nucleic acid-binding protein